VLTAGTNRGYNQRLETYYFQSAAARSLKTLCLIVKRQPTAQMAHLVFADSQPNAEKPKEPFFANAPTEKLTLD